MKYGDKQMADDMEKIEMMFMEWFAQWMCKLKDLDKYSTAELEMMERNLRGIWMSGLYIGIRLKGNPAHIAAPLSVN